jgi:hypothetical protein
MGERIKGYVNTGQPPADSGGRGDTTSTKPKKLRKKLRSPRAATTTTIAGSVTTVIGNVTGAINTGPGSQDVVNPYVWVDDDDE